ncbi:MAG: acyloxyacyl hydrolase [Prevotella sp.]|uniref:acyloxyacyl hydrolase n=1 Tax=Prevotella sp. TaxID=59823 RepID=UPI002A2E8D3D|nr:acyloxyacyl hydrolase [Prevotella sp.]MDD7319094.1 acyloxyacyl hydrolase [Prevotellaceae bacterium]MDY4019631.1 acyloxyacyl hydrolase [Prevotella sp.]
MSRFVRTLIALFFVPMLATAAERDSLRRFGAELTVGTGKVMSIDEYQKKIMYGDATSVFGISLTYGALPKDSDAFAADYGYPSFSFGLRYSDHHRVTMQRTEDPEWEQYVPVDYKSRMGNIVTAYASFNRPLLRTDKWEIDYMISMGVGYSNKKWNNRDAIDNLLIGSRWLIYFGAGLHTTYRIMPQWGIRAGIDYYHHSNGSMNMPNKGANVLGPVLGLVYYPYYDEVLKHRHHFRPEPFKRYFYFNFSASVGMKALNEEFQQTQFYTPPDSPDYCKNDFNKYVTWSAQADLMCRYARRWASGVGVDLFYGRYVDDLKEMEKTWKQADKYSRWSVGIAAKHEVFYRQFSIAMSFGWYLYRHVGLRSKALEQPYYERIGLYYTFRSLGNVRLGFNVKAHRTRADYTEMCLSVPIRLNL